MSAAVVVFAVGIALVLALLTAALVLAVGRIVQGPTILDRMIGSDMVLTTILLVLAAAMVVRRDLTGVPVLVVIAATSVFATLAVARTVTPSTDDPDASPDEDPSASSSASSGGGAS